MSFPRTALARSRLAARQRRLGHVRLAAGREQPRRAGEQLHRLHDQLRPLALADLGEHAEGLGHVLPDDDPRAGPSAQGQGEVLPIDSHPAPIYRLDGKPWRGRIQTYDAPFSLEKADSFTLHAQETGRASYIRGQAAQPVFDDRRQYWYPQLPTVGVKVPNAGVRMRVLTQNGTSMRVRIDSTKPAAP